MTPSRSPVAQAIGTLAVRSGTGGGGGDVYSIIIIKIINEKSRLSGRLDFPTGGPFGLC